MVLASIVLGVGILVVGARSLGSSLSANRRNGVQSVAEPTTYDHWHQAFAIDVCGTTLPPLVDRGTDQYGIHTHGDGIIHVHPFTNDVAGANATFGVFADQVGLVLGADQVRLPDGTTKANGDDCNGAPGRWQLVEWDVDDPTAEPVVRYSGFESVRFTADRHALTLAFLPSTTTPAQVPKPSSIPTLDQLSDAPSTTIRRPGSTSPRGTTPPSTTPPTTTAEQAAEAQAMLPLLIDHIDGLNAGSPEVVDPATLQEQDPRLAQLIQEAGPGPVVRRTFGRRTGPQTIWMVDIFRVPSAADAQQAFERVSADHMTPSGSTPTTPTTQRPAEGVAVFGPYTSSMHTAYVAVGHKGPYVVVVEQVSAVAFEPDTKSIVDQLAKLPG